MEPTPWEEERRKLDEFLRRDAADVVMDDAMYIFANGDMTFDQALMALLISELRGLNQVLDYR